MPVYNYKVKHRKIIFTSGIATLRNVFCDAEKTSTKVSKEASSQQMKK